MTSIDHELAIDPGRRGWSVSLLALLLVAGAAAAVAFPLHPTLALAALVGVAAAALAAARPLAGLVLIIAVVALFGSESILRLQLGIQLVEVDVVLLAALVGWLARWLAHGATVRWSRLDVWIVLFVVAVLFGIYRGLSRGIPLSDLRAELRPPVYLILFYLISRSFTGDRRSVHRVFTILALVTIVSAAKSLAVLSMVPTLAPGGSPERTILATRVMNSNGMQRVIAQGGEIFPVLVALLVLPWLGVVRRVGSRIAGWLALAVLLLAVAFSLTRSYWVGLAAGLVVLGVSRGAKEGLRTVKNVGVVGLVVVGLLVVIGIAAPTFPVAKLGPNLGHRLVTIGPGFADPSKTARLSEIVGIREAVQNSNWAGTGWGGTYTFYSTLTGGLKEWEYAHNSYAYWILKLGLLGLVPILLVVGAGTKSLLGMVRASAGETDRALSAGLLAAFVSLLVISITSPWLTHYVGAAWAGLLLGTAESIRLRPAAGREGGQS